jgi:small subunit ribosomal protein S6
MSTALAFETTYILRPHLSEAAIADASAAIAAEVTQHDGKVLTIEPLGKRRLAYEIDDVREGFYFVMTFECSQQRAAALKKSLADNESVLRSLVLRTGSE